MHTAQIAHCRQNTYLYLKVQPSTQAYFWLLPENQKKIVKNSQKKSQNLKKKRIKNAQFGQSSPVQPNPGKRNLEKSLKFWKIFFFAEKNHSLSFAN